MSFLLDLSGDYALWIVLAILAVLAICFYAYKHKAISAEGRNAPSASEPSVSDETDVTTGDDEIIAVIAAAIAAAEADSNGLKFKVVSFRRI